jgi:hypothetical protein
MSPEKSQYLKTSYPKIFSETAMYPCDVSANDGWFVIIDNLCRAIQKHIDHRKRDIEWDVNFNKKMEEAKNNGWENWPQHHVRELRVVREPIPQVVAVQVKEKFGGLRFYCDGGDEFTEGLIQMAEIMAECTCEVCGNPGSLRNRSWLKTLCDKHDT